MSTVGSPSPFTPPSENVPENKRKAPEGSQDSRVLRPIGENQKEYLQKAAEMIKKLDSPLLPKKDSNVYFLNPHVVFKPGKANTMRAILCQKVAKILGLEKSVLKTIEATASEVLSQRDLDDQGLPITYDRAVINGQEWLVNMEDASSIQYIISTDDGCQVKLHDGVLYTLKEEGDGFIVESTDADEDDETDFDKNEHVLIATIDDQDFLVKEESAHPVVGSDNLHVLREGTRFELRASQEGTTLIAKDVEGLLQPMVQDVVTQIGGVTVDTLRPSKAREAFFAMINPISFIDSVVLSVLFRTQDGKAADLNDSNFLFTKEGEQLNVTLIDLDETWPTQNDFSSDPELMKRGKGKISALRLGLMGYPQAHTPLTGEQKAHLLDLLNKIKDNSNSMMAVVDRYKVADGPSLEAVKNSFKEVIEKLIEFSNRTEFTLKDLVFHIFPEYQKQWQALEKTSMPQEEIATWIGYCSLDEVKRSKKLK